MILWIYGIWCSFRSIAYGFCKVKNNAITGFYFKKFSLKPNKSFLLLIWRVITVTEYKKNSKIAYHNKNLKFQKIN